MRIAFYEKYYNEMQSKISKKIVGFDLLKVLAKFIFAKTFSGVFILILISGCSTCEDYDVNAQYCVKVPLASLLEHKIDKDSVVACLGTPSISHEDVTTNQELFVYRVPLFTEKEKNILGIPVSNEECKLMQLRLRFNKNGLLERYFLRPPNEPIIIKYLYNGGTGMYIVSLSKE